MLSKRGACSRTEAARWILAGRVSVAGRVVRDPEHPVAATADVSVDGVLLGIPTHAYVMLNKPRGLVTTRSDERGRETVYRCFEGTDLPWLAPVGRLDKASEGLLLFSNDPAWAARVTDPGQGTRKTYHVQVGAIPDPALLSAMASGAEIDGVFLRAVSAQVLRTGQKHAWLEVVLDEGRNRHIRRLLGALGVDVLRLVRVAIGDLALGELPKGHWRPLTGPEIASLRMS